MYVKVSDKEWEEQILKSDNAYFFSSPTWAKIIEKSFDDYRIASRLYHINDKSILIPMMEKNTYGRTIPGFKLFDSMPMGPGGLFSESEITTDDFRCLVENIIGSRHIFYLALPYFMDLSYSDNSIKVRHEWNVKDERNYTHILSLDGKDFEDVQKNYKKRTRNSITKAIRSGVETRDATSLNDFKEFYEIWSTASKNWDAQETYDFGFFKNLYKFGFPQVKLSLASIDEKTIAGIIAFFYSKTIYYIFSSFNESYSTFNATSLLLNNLIKKACQKNIYKYINFGSSGTNEGLKKFKEGFGAEKKVKKRYLASSTFPRIIQRINNPFPNLLHFKIKTF